MKRIYRLAYFVSHPIQYEVELLRRIAAHPAIDLQVFFFSTFSVGEFYEPGFGAKIKWDKPLLEGYKHIFLPAFGRTDLLSFWRPMMRGLWRHLKDGQFDALWVHGYAHFANLQAIAMAKLLGMKVLLRGESHLKSCSRSKSKVWTKQCIFPSFLRLVDGFLAIGTLNREYYLHYGVPKERIYMMPYAVDNGYFQARAEAVRTNREDLRSKLKLTVGRPVILYVSKFQPRKRAADLLNAYIHLSPNGVQEPNPYLLFIGDGEERPHLEAQVRKLGWTSVRFLGFKNQSELPYFYDLCDVFVLPSDHEPWGLVVNEVMNYGKAVIVSDQVGAGPDLVQHGKNGFVVPVGDIDTLADRLNELTADPGLVRSMGDGSLARINHWSFEQDLGALLEALDGVVDRKSELWVSR